MSEEKNNENNLNNNNNYNHNLNIPNIITQVSRNNNVNDDEELYEGGISSRKLDEGEEEEMEIEYEKPFTSSLLRKIFCCFFSGVQNPLLDVSSGQAALLPPQSNEHIGRKCLLLDLDETLVHSSFKPVSGADFIIPVEIEGQTHKVYVSKRPGVDNFLKVVGDHFEVVIFTASLSLYADPVIDLLDLHQVVKWRLFRESCTFHNGFYVKDLSRVGRKLNQTMIIDNSPSSFLFHPEYAIEIGSWFDDMNDTELIDMLPLLKNKIAKCKDIRVPLKKWKSEKNNLKNNNNNNNNNNNAKL